MTKFLQEQRINDEKFVELKIKIDEYSEMFGAESMSSKLPPIAENDKLEKEVIISKLTLADTFYVLQLFTSAAFNTFIALSNVIDESVR